MVRAFGVLVVCAATGVAAQGVEVGNGAAEEDADRGVGTSPVAGFSTAFDASEDEEGDAASHGERRPGRNRERAQPQRRRGDERGRMQGRGPRGGRGDFEPGAGGPRGEQFRGPGRGGPGRMGPPRGFQPSRDRGRDQGMRRGDAQGPRRGGPDAQRRRGPGAGPQRGPQGFGRRGPDGFGPPSRGRGGEGFADQLFDRLDADGDGAITREEFDEARQQRGAGPRGPDSRGGGPRGEGRGPRRGRADAGDPFAPGAVEAGMEA